MKKRIGFCTLLATCSALLLGIFAVNNSKTFAKVEAAKEVDADIFGVQLRSGGTGLNYLVITDTTIDVTQGHMSKSGDGYNAPSYINVYTSANATATSLSSIIDSSKNWDINLWSSQGIMFPITDATYQSFNGTTIYAIEVLQGCTYPNNQSKTCVVPQTRKFYNQHYGDSSVRDFAIEWAETTPIEPSDVTIELTGGQVRADVDSGSYYICLTSDVYSGTQEVQYVSLSMINAYSKVKLFFSATDTGTYLGNATSLRSGCQNLWGSNAFHFALTAEEYEVYNGTDLFKMEIEAGCQVVLNNRIVTIPTSYTFINQNYKDPTFKYGAFYFLPNSTPITGPISIVDAQVRADVNNNFYFIDVRAAEYNGTPVILYENLDNLINAYSHIKIYLSENDQGTLLSNVTTLRHAYQNLWISEALLFALTAEEYENTYNGTTIYAIEVLRGCELIINNEKVEVDQSYRFVNSDYGKASAKYEAFNFRPEVIVDMDNLGDIGFVGFHNRMDRDSGYRWLMFFMDDNIYNVSLEFNEWIYEINFLDNVLIYLSEGEEHFTLRDIFEPNATGVTLQLFNTKNMLAVSINNEPQGESYRYSGPNMYKIIINEGTQIPAYENGVVGYRTTTSKTVFINDDYQLSGDIPGTNDDYGNPRIYEEWNVNWSLVSCYVTFTVVGIDGLSFPDMLLERGQTISLERFEQEGYDLVVTTSTGDRVYQNIVGTNYNIDFILTYTRSKGNGGQINTTAIIISASVGGALLIAGAVVLVIVLKKRKGIKA